MLRPLHLHPTSRCGASIAVSVEAERPARDRLRLTFRVSGAVGALHVPAPATPIRTDELWKRTCFEAFVLPGPGQGYVEFNLAPSGRWATYRFDRYRKGMRDALDVTPEPIAFDQAPDRLTLSVAAAMPTDLAERPRWRLGLSGVIEEASGHVSYWALAHPSPQPDFHNAASFVHELSA